MKSRKTETFSQQGFSKEKREIWNELLHSKTRTILGIAGIAIGLIFMANLIRSLDFSSVRGIIFSIGFWGLAAILVPYSVAALVDSQAWRLLLRSSERKPLYRTIFRIRTATEAMVITLPAGSVVSDPAKAWLLKRTNGYSLSSTAPSIVFRKTMLGLSQGSVAVLVAIVAFLNPRFIEGKSVGEGLVWTLFIFAGCVTVLYGIIVGLICNEAFVHRVHRWLVRLPFPKISVWFEAKEAQFHEFNRQLRSFRGIGSIARFLGFYSAMWVTEMIETVIILTLLHANLTIPEAWIMEASCVLLRSSLAIVPGGLGIQDTGYAGIITGNGNSPEIAAAFIVLKRLREILWSIAGYSLLATFRVSSEQADNYSASASSRLTEEIIPVEL